MCSSAGVDGTPTRSATSDDRSYELLSVPDLQSIAPAHEIAFVRLLGRQVDDFGKAHRSKLRYEVEWAEGAQPWLSDRGRLVCGSPHNVSFASRQRF